MCILSLVKPAASHGCYNPAVTEEASPSAAAETSASPLEAAEQQPLSPVEQTGASSQEVAEPQDPLPDLETTAPGDESRYIRIRRSHFYAVLLPLAFVAGIAYGYLIWGKPDATPPTSANTTDTTEAGFSTAVGRIEVETDDDPTLGPADAPITIIEFSDFSCPFCQRWHQEVFDPLMAAYPGQIRFIYRDFPIVGGGGPGMAAAQAANCAREQGLYWEYHNALFSAAYALNPEGFEEAAAAVGADSGALIECFQSGRYEAEAQADLRYGAGIGVSGTPTFFINGIPLVGAQPLLRFVEIINSELGG
jgi:protein-disulfide isomerase